jgi:hypothetical protein
MWNLANQELDYPEQVLRWLADTEEAREMSTADISSSRQKSRTCKIRKINIPRKGGRIPEDIPALDLTLIYCSYKSAVGKLCYSALNTAHVLNYAQRHAQVWGSEGTFYAFLNSATDGGPLALWTSHLNPNIHV